MKRYEVRYYGNMDCEDFVYQETSKNKNKNISENQRDALVLTCKKYDI